MTSFQFLDEQTIWVAEADLPGLFDYLHAHLNPAAITAAVCASPEDVPEGNWMQLDELKHHHDAHWIDEVIAEQRIRTVFQPIMKMRGRTAEVAGYEFLSRAVAKDGALIPPFKMFEAARTRDRLFALDRACRLVAMRNANRVGDERLVFVNFIPTAIYSPEHCLQTTLAEAQRSGVTPSSIVFEVVESEEVANLDHLENILLYYRRHGFRYALDDVGAGYATLDKVERLRPDFVKLDMHYVQGVAHDPEKQQVARELHRIATEVGARTLAEGVEEESDWQWLVETGYELFQGYLFGKPDEAPKEPRVQLP